MQRGRGGHGPIVVSIGQVLVLEARLLGQGGSAGPVGVSAGAALQAGETRRVPQTRRRVSARRLLADAQHLRGWSD